MSRSEQFIGLTSKGEKFLSIVKGSNNFISEELIVSDVLLPFTNEFIKLRKITLKAKEYSDINSFELFVENVQLNPWVSGPLYFINLKHYIVKKSGQILELGECYSWIKDPLIDTLYEKESGSFNL